jgi:hypothetical protein
MLNQSWFVNVQRFNKLSRYIIQQKEAIELVSSHDCILVMAIAQRTHMYRCQSWQQVPLRAVNLCCTDAWKIQELLYQKSYSTRALGELATHTFPLRLIPVVPSHTFCFCRCVSFPTSQNHCVCLSQKNPHQPLSGKRHRLRHLRHRILAPALRHPPSSRPPPVTAGALRHRHSKQLVILVTCGSASALDWLGFRVSAGGTKSRRRCSRRMPRAHRQRRRLPQLRWIHHARCPRQGPRGLHLGKHPLIHLAAVRASPCTILWISCFLFVAIGWIG